MAYVTRLGGVLRQTASKLVTSSAQGLPSIYTTIRGVVSSKLFIGGLSFNTQEDSLRQAFSSHGDIEEVRIITDRETGRSRGFGFVKFFNESEAEAALQGMDGKVLDGRAIRVDYASNDPPPPRGGGFGGGRGGFGGGGGFGSRGSEGSDFDSGDRF